MKASPCATLAVAALLTLPCVPAWPDQWTDEYAKAQQRAKAEGKAMLLDFTGSDWCGWCKKLDAEVFSKKEFKKYADEHLVCVKLDFPRSFSLSSKTVHQNEDLARKFGVGGYPTIILLDPEGEKIGATGYKAGGADNYVKYLDEIIGPHEKNFKAAAPPPGAAAGPAGMRTWTSTKGSTLEARYDQRIGSQVQLRKADGSSVKISIDSLSEADKEFLKSIRAL